MSEDQDGAEAPETTTETPQSDEPPVWAQRLLERVEAIDKRTAPQPPRNEARAGYRRPEAGRVRSQKELGQLALEDPRRFAQLMSDDTFNPADLPVK